MIPARKLVVLVTIAVASLGAGCDSETTADPTTSDAAGDGANDGSANDWPAGMVELAKAATVDVEVEMFAKAALAQGWQQVFYRVKSSGKAVTSAAIVQHPVMTMAQMKHACPLVQPAATASADGLFVGELLFQMASSDTESWTLELEVTPAGGAHTTVALGKLEVAATPWSRTLVVGDGMTAERYTVVVHFPNSLKVGMNDYRVALHRASSDMMTYVPVTSATILASPEMPSMGHGSANSVAPVQTADGFYAGTVNCTMPGDWRLTVAVSVGGNKVGDAVFDWTL